MATTSAARRRNRRGNAAKKTSRKARNTKISSNNPTSLVAPKPSKKPTTLESQIPNLLLLGFQKGKHFEDMLKWFTDHGVTDRRKMNKMLQEQWGSCPKYSNALKKYWWNIQKQRHQYYAMIKREKRHIRAIQAQKSGLANMSAICTPARAICGSFNLDNGKVKKEEDDKRGTIDSGKKKERPRRIKNEIFKGVLNSKVGQSNTFGGDNYASGANKIPLPAKSLYSDFAKKASEVRYENGFFINKNGDKWVKLRKKTSDEELNKIAKRLEGVRFE
ncbi:hypothetical protein TWF694_001227 [Orbilia ellipsospora]|uniref:Nucleolar protein 16 n=1 Tax=Orbilia ellipsospora TaxID=2528407 RepID=A0AAV9XUB3_9PEZI